MVMPVGSVSRNLEWINMLPPGITLSPDPCAVPVRTAVSPPSANFASVRQHASAGSSLLDPVCREDRFPLAPRPPMGQLAAS
jgi:hypothetical protein